MVARPYCTARARRGRGAPGARIAHYAMDHDLTLKAAALKLGFVTEEAFDRVVDPAKMVKPYVATAT
jgi:fumarate hydratase class II